MRTIVVTGADRGIGEALCLEALARGDRPIAACYEDSSALRAKGVRVESGVDVTSDRAVADFAARLRGTAVDVLLHVAGLVVEHPLGKLDFGAMAREYEVNALGPLRVTQALLPMLRTGAKIGVVTSRVGSLGDNGSGGLYGYRMSKAAANMAGLNLARDLRGQGIAVICLHPGTVRTQMTKGLNDTRTMGLLVEPEAAARGLLARIDELDMNTTGTFRHANGDTLPW